MFVGAIRRFKPLRGFPIWARWLLSALIVFVEFGLRIALDVETIPYLWFIPGIIVTSFVFDRGSGFVATFLSAGLALYFFVTPLESFEITDLDQLVALAVFTLSGLLVAAIIEALRHTVDELAGKSEELDRALREAERDRSLLDSVVDGTPDIIYVKDRNGCFVHVNQALCQVFGLPRQAIVGHCDRDFLPPDQTREIEDHDRTVMQGGKAVMLEERVNAVPPGANEPEPRLYLSSKAPWYDATGEIVGLIGVSRDITERKHAEDALQSADRQKALLLADINHRIKNHLQSVVGVLEIASRRAESLDDARAALDQAARRLGVLGRVYDQLQLRDDATAVRADRFLSDLCGDLRATLVGLRPIALRVQAEPVELDSTEAVNIGLIVNELVQNALKYAFPDDLAGTVAVRLERQDDCLFLEVADDGVGRSDSTQSSGTGSRLLRALAQQLGGALEWSGPPGTRAALRFRRHATADLA